QDYDVVYDAASGAFTVTDLNASDGDEGSDTVAGVETLRFADGTLDLSGAVADLPVATDSALLTPEVGVASWKLTGSGGGASGVTYSIAASEGAADVHGWVTLASGAKVRVTDPATGTYEYDPNGYSGSDSFGFRVTDANGISSQAQVNVGVGEPGTGYDITAAAQLEGSDGHLTRTPSSAGDQGQWVISTWVKRSQLDSVQNIFSAGDGGAAEGYLRFNSDNTLEFENDYMRTTGDALISSTVFADTDSFHHIVVAADVTQGTAAERVRLWVDGVPVSWTNPNDFDEANGIIGSSVPHTIGKNERYDNAYFSGNIADFQYLDGVTITDPAAAGLGAFDSESGAWEPAAYSGAYGAQGFHLDFSDANNLGNDVSSNANDWTVSGGVTQTADTPLHNAAVLTHDGIGGSYTTYSITDGNRQFRKDGAGMNMAISTLTMDAAADTYAEFVLEDAGISTSYLGVVQTAPNAAFTAAEPGVGTVAGDYGYNSAGNVRTNGGNITSYAAFAAGDVLGVRLNAGELTFYKNGVLQGVTATGLTGVYHFGVQGEQGAQWQARFSAAEQQYAPAGASDLAEVTETGVAIPTATSGHDSFAGGAEADTFDGLAGDDQLIGGG
ncbi:MAG: Ig-like domain-containing protein, partial [Pirellulales bacterium]|nr:Ig-like domain-containing protein [Pirellulales bacterium]